MDIETLRIVMTVAAFVAYLGIVWWAYGPSRKARFEADARLLFIEDQHPEERRP